MVIVVGSIAWCIIFGVPRLPIRTCHERPPAMYGHFCLVPRVSVHDRYYCRPFFSLSRTTVSNISCSSFSLSAIRTVSSAYLILFMLYYNCSLKLFFYHHTPASYDTLRVSYVCIARVSRCNGPGVVPYRSSRRLSSKRYYKLPVVIIMLIRVKHIPVVIYNINAMQINLISCADINEI